MPRWFGVIERDPFVRALLAAPVPLPEVLVRTVVGEAYRTLAFAAPRAAAAEVVRVVHPPPPRRATRSRSVLANGRRLLPELARDGFALRAITFPVLLIWGDRDRMVTHSRLAPRPRRAARRRTYVLLDGVGHCPQVEAPERFVAALEEFAMRHHCCDPS